MSDNRRDKIVDITLCGLLCVSLGFLGFVIGPVGVAMEALLLVMFEILVTKGKQ